MKNRKKQAERILDRRKLIALKEGLTCVECDEPVTIDQVRSNDGNCINCSEPGPFESAPFQWRGKTVVVRYRGQDGSVVLDNYERIETDVPMFCKNCGARFQTRELENLDKGVCSFCGSKEGYTSGWHSFGDLRNLNDSEKPI